jgi:hypothetical protein
MFRPGVRRAAFSLINVARREIAQAWQAVQRRLDSDQEYGSRFVVHGEVR